MLGKQGMRVISCEDSAGERCTALPVTLSRCSCDIFRKLCHCIHFLMIPRVVKGRTSNVLKSHFLYKSVFLLRCFCIRKFCLTNRAKLKLYLSYHDEGSVGSKESGIFHSVDVRSGNSNMHIVHLLTEA